MSDQTVLFPGEAEKLIESLRPMLPKMVGSQEWYRQQEYIDKLTVQAVLSASNQSDEYIKEFLITHQKIDILVELIISMEIWRENVLSRMLKANRCPSQTFGLYGLLYGEATTVTLLETVLYHDDSADGDGLNNGLLDIVDYCHRAVSTLLSHCDDMKYRRLVYSAQKGLLLADSQSAASVTEEITTHLAVLSYQIALKCVSILHYLIGRMALLPMALANRLFCTFDVPLLLLEVMYKAPWSVELENGKMAKFIDNKWMEQDHCNSLDSDMSKLQGQLWLSIYQLLLSKECREKYELSGHRKTTLLKLRAYLNDVVIDRLPMLGDLRRYLEQLSLMEPGNTRPNLVLEQVAEFRDTIMRDYVGKWSDVFESFVLYQESSQCAEDLKRQAIGWAETYSGDAVDRLMSDAPRCPVCGEPAAKRCSRCKSEWYCRRECQVEHWKKHKNLCDLLVNNNNK